jgi:2-aminomuconate deaminase
MSDNQRISTAKAPKPVGLYPHARKVGDLLFLSGVGPRTAGSDATDSAVPGLELDKNGNFISFLTMFESFWKNLVRVGINW